MSIVFVFVFMGFEPAIELNNNNNNNRCYYIGLLGHAHRVVHKDGRSV